MGLFEKTATRMMKGQWSMKDTENDIVINPILLLLLPFLELYDTPATYISG